MRVRTRVRAEHVCLRREDLVEDEAGAVTVTWPRCEPLDGVGGVRCRCRAERGYEVGWGTTPSRPSSCPSPAWGERQPERKGVRGIDRRLDHVCPHTIAVARDLDASIEMAQDASVCRASSGPREARCASADRPRRGSELSHRPASSAAFASRESTTRPPRRCLAPSNVRWRSREGPPVDRSKARVDGPVSGDDVEQERLESDAGQLGFGARPIVWCNEHVYVHRRVIIPFRKQPPRRQRAL